MESDQEDLIPETASPTPAPSVCSTLSLAYHDQVLSSREDDVAIVRSSLPELRSIKVNWRATTNEAPPLLSVIPMDMSVSGLMDLILQRCRITGLDTSAYCLVARTSTKGRDVGVETTVLDGSSFPLTEDKDKLKRSRFSIRQRGGRLVDVYDGRKWPVVRCGSVYVTSTDTAHRVTQSVLCTPNVQEKKRKASKYTVAIGTSHGHVQAFLKENDTVFPVFERCSAEEKCLLLIKKPKDASKKMLKSQIGTSLSVSDTHLYRQFDGTASNHPLTAHIMKNKPSKSQSQTAMMSQVYTSEPRVRKAPPSKVADAKMGGRVTNFVPIPELGIFTPEQHVLQNGTYAQHCHLREVNNNSNLNNNGKTGENSARDRSYQYSNGYHPDSQNRRSYDTQSHAKNQYHTSNMAPDNHAHSNMNSSFESSNHSDIFHGPDRPQGQRPDYRDLRDAQLPPENAVYHSCMDISALPSTDRDFNSLKSNSGIQSSRMGAEPISEAYSEKGPADSSSKDHDFDTIRSDQTYEHRYRPRRDNDNRDKKRKDMTPRRVESPGKKLDTSSRSHSLGDLSSGLTFSLVGQKKPDSMLSVATCPATEKSSPANNSNYSNKRENDSVGERYSYTEQGRSSLNHVNNVQALGNTTNVDDPYASDSTDEVDGDYLPRSESSSTLQHIRDRLQKAVLNSQWKYQSHSQTLKAGNNKRAGASSDQRKDKGSSISSATISKLREASGGETGSRASSNQYMPHQATSHFSEGREPHYNQNSQPQQQNSTNHPRAVHSKQPPSSARYARQYSAPESVPPPQTSSPVRRDSVETTSSYQSAFSDPIQLREQLVSARIPQRNNNNDNRTDDSSSSDRYLSYPTSEREKSPVKPKRSLPQVSLTETSERIKRFTEIMKSRVSNHSSASNSRNGYSADGASSGSQCTPTRMSSVETTASARSVSRKSSIECVSDNEIGNAKPASARNGEYSQANGGSSDQRGRRTQEFQEQNHWGDKDKTPRNFSQPKSYSISGDNNIDRRDERGPPPQSLYNNRYEQDANKQLERGRANPQGQSHYTGQTHQLNPEDVPLPPGDRSSDSGQTSGTSNSYTGSVLDSGYTTNNDGENDPYHYHPHHHHHSSSNNNNNNNNLDHQPHFSDDRNHRQNPAVQHYEQRPQLIQQQQQHPNYSDPRNGQQRQERRRPPPPSSRHRTNLLNGRQFGSVQNVSSAQAHGNPKDMPNSSWQPALNDKTSKFDTLPKSLGNPLYPDQNKSTSRMPYSAREMSTDQNAQILNNVHNALMPPDGGPFQYKTATRRSWDYSDAHGLGRTENEMAKYHRNETRYRSTDVICHTDNVHQPKDSFYSQPWNKHRPAEPNFRTVNASRENGVPPPPHYHYRLQHQQQQQQQQHHQYPSNPPSIETSNHIAPLYHANHPSNKPDIVKQNHSYDTPYASENNPRSSEQHRQSNHPPVTAADQANVKQRPVPISRSNRNMRGRTLPGGFRFNESDMSDFGQATAFNFELSLYHLTQKYELSPLCLDLPKHLTLKDMVSLKEVTVEISLTESLGITGSPKGQTPKIGSPDSAFTPVKNEMQVSGPPAILKIKVLSFTKIWKEVEKYCMLGLMLEADILVEVNGWLCLGADVAYLQRIVENCQGAITLTVARPRETDEKRYKGQTPAERVKSLESEISRLDDLIHARDEKIKELTAAVTAASTGKQILSNVNGKVPCEGMVIGEDEYVV